tara:strand:- start:124 stop:384 length:261 start_codon:yes stop_codon:yes gene_type:complete
MLETFTFTVVVAGLVFNVMNFLTLKKKGSRCDRECFCRYPDADVRDIIIDYELEKAKKLDKAIHKVEDMDNGPDDPFDEPHDRNKI